MSSTKINHKFAKITKLAEQLNSSHSNGAPSSNRKSNLIQRNQVLNEHARDRRRKQQLAQLERDNFHDDPHANLTMHKKAPKFEDTINSATPNRKSTSSVTNKIKSLTFPVLIEDDLKSNPLVNYSTIAAPAPDAMYVAADNQSRWNLFNEWLLSQTDKEPNENELNSNTDDDENELMDVDEKSELKKAGRVDSAADGQQADVQYRRLLTVTKRHFCCVCGFQAPYTCITCGTRYCCSSCLKTHKDTRCLKWTA